MPPRMLGICASLPERYQWKCRAGKGGMGEVHQALDRQTGTLVAVKVLHSRGMIEMARFNQEARVLAELSHPGIVRYSDHGVTPTGAPYIAMEWLEGETLEDRLARGRLDPEEAAEVAQHVLGALAAAHGRDIVHRDIKPGNIFLVGGKLSNARVLDFGIARRRQDSKRFTRDGATVGTPLYTSPEQARGRGDVDGRADIFSLGCVLYEALSGDPPFMGNSPLEVMTKICAGGAPELSSKRAGLPRALCSLVGSMLAPDAAHRPQSAGILANEFAEMVRVLRAVAATAASPAAGAQGRRGGSTERERRTAVAMLVSLGKRGKGDEMARLVEVQRLLDQMGCGLDRLVDRKLLVTADLSTIGEQAVRLATAALALWKIAPTARMAIATGRAGFIGNLPVGPLMDRLPTMLVGGEGPTIRIDEATQRLLPARFVTGDSMEHRCLLSTGVPPLVVDAGVPADEPTPTPLPIRPRRSSVADG